MDLESRVEAALGRLEERMGATHPLRRVPIDLIAQAVVTELAGADSTDAAIAHAVDLIADRNAPARRSIVE